MQTQEIIKHVKNFIRKRPWIDDAEDTTLSVYDFLSYLISFNIDISKYETLEVHDDWLIDIYSYTEFDFPRIHSYNFKVLTDDLTLTSKFCLEAARFAEEAKDIIKRASKDTHHGQKRCSLINRIIIMNFYECRNSNLENPYWEFLRKLNLSEVEE